MKLSFILTPNSITKILLKIIFCLLVADLISIYLKWVLGFETALGIVPLFDFDTEFNVPSFYSSLAILFSAGLLWYIAKDEEIKNGKRKALYWNVLTYVFIFLSLDELVGIHNQFGRLIGALFGNFKFVNESRLWILAYTPILLLFLIYLIGFFKKLTKATLLSFIIAGVVFTTGAIIVELAGDQYMMYHDKADIFYGIIYTLEELLEMIGIVLFIRALVYHISLHTSKQYIDIEINFKPKTIIYEMHENT
jgi:hypothetical protein